MKSLKTPILPTKLQFAKTDNKHEIDFEAICIFASTGFFLDDDTYFKDEVCLSPSHEHFFDKNNFLVESKPWFEWHYTPRPISFERALEEYIELLTAITKEQISDQPVILPLSGGLDSRSLALVLKDVENPVHSYSYAFPGGYPEHKISKQVAKTCNFTFESFMISNGYLWSSIDDLAQLNGCYSEFTHPRQMGVLEKLKQMKGNFSLGHWGDVLFDRGAPEDIEEKDIVPLLLKKMLKPGGLEFAQALWDTWNLEGEFKSYLTERIENSLSKIKIENISARVRAFKTSQWAHRWTTTNLCAFEAANPINLPYYDDRMLQFICTIPEEYLADRRLQIAHLKQNKALSNITWQEHTPFNLNNYNLNKPPFNLPYKVFYKLKRVFNSILGNPYIQRNFELQFIGNDNDIRLKQHLFEKDLKTLIPEHITKNVYESFNSSNYVAFSHPISMLLTLSVWQEKNKNKID